MVFYLSSSDPVVASSAQDIFKELAQIEGCQGPMQMRLIPTLVSIMQAPPDKIPTGLCAVRNEFQVSHTLPLIHIVCQILRKKHFFLLCSIIFSSTDSFKPSLHHFKQITLLNGGEPSRATYRVLSINPFTCFFIYMGCLIFKIKSLRTHSSLSVLFSPDLHRYFDYSGSKHKTAAV